MLRTGKKKLKVGERVLKFFILQSKEINNRELKCYFLSDKDQGKIIKSNVLDLARGARKS